jgi:hypothetical protein
MREIALKPSVTQAIEIFSSVEILNMHWDSTVPNIMAMFICEFVVLIKLVKSQKVCD